VRKTRPAASGDRIPSAYMGRALSKSMQPRRAGWPLVGLLTVPASWRRNTSNHGESPGPSGFLCIPFKVRSR
jgi:hypothetical protein